MEANVRNLDVVLNERQQWVVPVYQRHYEWKTDEDQQIPNLWADMQDKALENLEQRTAYPHYFGAIIFSETESQAFGTVRKRFLVDGQQRITSFHLVLTAIREVARSKEILRSVDAVNAYLFNEKSASMQDPNRERFKLWSSSYDRNLYQNIVQKTPDELRSLESEHFYKNGKIKKGNVPNLLKAYYYLIEKIDEFINDRADEFGEGGIEKILNAILHGFLYGFQIVVIQLGQNDDAQEIFASLNGRAEPLSPFDLIRNDVFHRAQRTGEDDQKLFDEHWRIFEQPFWTELVSQGRFKRARADHLIAHAVIAETAQEANIGKIASEYQRYARKREFPTVADELNVLIGHAKTYKLMEDPNYKGVLSRISHILKIWASTTFHPLVLAVNAKKVDDKQKSKVLRCLENYIIRREICGLTNKRYNLIVAGFVKQIQKDDNPLDAFKLHLASLTGDASRMPTDAEISKAFAQRQVYGHIPTPRLRFILEQLEYEHRSKFDEVTSLAEALTIEHIMPKKWAENWHLAGGMRAPCESSIQVTAQNHRISDEMKDLMDARERVIDTFGNLTLLTGTRNPSLGNAGWDVKKKEIVQSLLAINRSIASSDTWSEIEIEERASTLGKMAIKIWPQFD